MGKKICSSIFKIGGLMDFYPFYKELQEESKNFDKGNFSLWFNKILFEVDDRNDFKIVDKENSSGKIYKEYKKMLDNKEIQILLDEKIKNQKDFSEQLSQKYKFIQFEGKLKSDFIIGLGESHPTETGMILDHTIGVPYIPASTIKGAVRFAYTLNYIDENKDNLPTEQETIKVKDGSKKNIIVLKEKDTTITKLFGGENKEDKEYVEKVGKIIFLDSYSEKTPKLKLDVMTPHYGDYYKDGKIAPADNQDPTPIKFLSIEKGQKFIFNVLIVNEIINEKGNIEKAFKRALEIEGVGAKTAIGYGRFEVKVIEHKSEEEILKEKEDKYIKSISNNTFNFDSWQEDEEFKDSIEIAQKVLEKKLIKPKKANGDFSKNFLILSQILNTTPEQLLNESKPDNNPIETSSESVNTDEIRNNLRKSVLTLKEKNELSKKESKKLEKLIKKIKNEFPDLVNELKI
jgi:CRISPR-associated protein Cmr6